MTEPTPAQLNAFRAYVQTGNQKQAAHVLGISTQTLKNSLSALYEHLDVGGAMEAATALGWVTLPGDGPAPCAWRGSCGRPRGHSGHHGSFVG
jgi:hypothetical protein